MREILFRAKRFDTKEWIEGYFVQQKNNLGGIHSCIFQNSEEENRWEMKRVHLNTVCQYTGLTDKSGRKYEGDIFQASDGDYIQRYIIVWDEDSLEWSAQCIGDPDGTLPLSEFRVSEIEVIGNIFDNPELIGEQP